MKLNTLKSILVEAISTTVFNATKLKAADIIDLLRQSYNDKDNEVFIGEAEQRGELVYAGWSDQSHSHAYHYPWFDSDDTEQWHVVAIYISLGKDGKLHADFGGMPVATFDEENEIPKYFKRLKAKVK